MRAGKTLAEIKAQQVRKRTSFALFYTKNDIILPRQARDKHRESTPKRDPFMRVLTYSAKTTSTPSSQCWPLGAFPKRLFGLRQIVTLQTGNIYQDRLGSVYTGKVETKERDVSIRRQADCSQDHDPQGV